jgi:hypothetical protein
MDCLLALFKFVLLYKDTRCILDFPLRYIIRSIYILSIILVTSYYDNGPLGFWCWNDFIIPLMYLFGFYFSIMSLHYMEFIVDIMKFVLAITIFIFAGSLMICLVIYSFSLGIPFFIVLCFIVLRIT